jgi:hypothetical protein
MPPGKVARKEGVETHQFSLDRVSEVMKTDTPFAPVWFDGGFWSRRAIEPLVLVSEAKLSNGKAYKAVFIRR